MSGIDEHPSRSVKIVGWAQLFLFSLNIAWITAWCAPGWSMRIFSWESSHGLQFWLVMPQGPALHIFVTLVVLLSLPIFVFLLSLQRVAVLRVFLRALAGAFAIAAFPLFALRFPDAFPLFGREYPPYPSVAEHAHLLFLETLAVLAYWIAYCLRRRPLSWGIGLLVLATHFSLWAWKAGTYIPGSWSVYFTYPFWAAVVLVEFTYYYGFPVFGFLSALTSGWHLKTSPERAAIEA